MATHIAAMAASSTHEKRENLTAARQKRTSAPDPALSYRQYGPFAALGQMYFVLDLPISGHGGALRRGERIRTSPHPSRHDKMPPCDNNRDSFTNALSFSRQAVVLRG